MLIVPVFNKADKKTPLVCLALILINAFIYFFIQSGDPEIHQEAYGYYETSGLLSLELKAYQDYLNKNDNGTLVKVSKKENERKKLRSKMFADEKFQWLLSEHLIITDTHADFKKWREKRNQFEKIKNRAVIYRYGYSPQKNNSFGLFTCTFLHGGIMHLVGNMVFLWLVGAILEKAIGAGLFAALYVVTGICASALFGLVYPLSPGPLVGASGAIAGLMGAYGIIFNLRKIRIFYSLGFYFNYASIPAIALFPIWLINEIFQLVANKGSNVAYMAHIGGLLSGIIIGTIYRYTSKARIEALFSKEEKQNEQEILLDSGMKKLIELDLPGARQDFEQVLKIDPKNRSVIKQLFVIGKTNPETEEFHKSAHRLLTTIKNEDVGEYIAVFEEYRSVAQKTRLTLEILEQLSHCYLTVKNLSKAASCISALLKRSPKNSKLPGFLMTLAQGHNENNKEEEATKCYKVLAARYATTSEGMEAAEYLKIF